MGASHINRKELEKSLCQFIEVELCEGITPVTPDTSFEALALDSIFLMEIVLFLEKESGIQITSHMLNETSLTSVRELVGVVFSES